LSFESLENRALMHGGALSGLTLPLPGSIPLIVPATYPIPALTSNAGAPVSLYLDFDGHTQASYGGWDDAQTPAFDLDGNPAAFNGAEFSRMREIWARVVEDFAPFDLSVTTVDPGTIPDDSTTVPARGDWSPICRRRLGIAAQRPGSRMACRCRSLARR
jgi:hypothetical protein